MPDEQDKHEYPELERKSRIVMEVVKQAFPKDHVLAFVASTGEGGGIAYMSTMHRDDTVALLMEWLSKVMGVWSKEQIVNTLTKIIEEWPDDEPTTTRH